MIPQHPQFPFVTKSGKHVTVDAGLFEILSIIRDMGCDTQFSCESNRGQAYILMPTADARRLEKIMRYSALAPRFHSGSRSLEISHFKGTNQLFEFTIRRSRRKTAIFRPYSIERLASRKYGYRTVYRWPAKDNQFVLEELSKASQKKHTL